MPRIELSADETKREASMLRELRKFHVENQHLGQPLVSSVTKQRVRIPRTDVDTNPFCLERQLADEYELLNFNKNPRFYIPSIKNSPRIDENPHNHSSFINEAADLMASSGFSPRVRAEFMGATPAVSFQPMQFPKPTVVSVDQGDLRLQHAPPTKPEKVISPRVPPAHEYYSTPLSNQQVSFGHRPRAFAHAHQESDSASRMYNPVTSSLVVRKRKQRSAGAASVSIKTGMSVMQLQELLTPSKAKQVTEPTTSKASKVVNHKKSPRALSEDDEGDRKTEQQRRIEELERNYYSKVYVPPRPRKEIRHHPPEASTAELLEKFRKLAVGVMPDAEI
ncbi:TPA: LOW QUALITY PROTEIN: hypothetical protein N0F65_012498 [Lagenidium giganteum]|uniref:Uncharacterized protein n=1 Tax=Lagenidium giganteum TaxID=4803 RepID=A0AAV2YT45_9STRA|nr:TPA: LOW QUALITY PROTEIN: hypothetical protein N0F65_012498 [Lagenidium giganteum]